MTLLTPDSGVGRTLAEQKLLAVLVIDDAAAAVPVATALLEGGVAAMELTLRTPAALESLKLIREALPEMTVGIGTILTTEQVRETVATDAHFGVAPGVNPEVVRCAHEHGLPFGPGVMTPSDIDAALREGCRLLKFFPAESSGGLAHLKNIAAPFAHLGPKFVPLGGVTLENTRSYLDSDLVAAVGGSWLAPRQTIREGDFGQIERNAREARRTVGD
ncbi:MAG: bifunctional 4-hydroxy-2-oxoglutarate aldolase/2-dehydro-3-deoxy-phosphogluconate aldolase [Verrucomicrobiales bacterium]